MKTTKLANDIEIITDSICNVNTVNIGIFINTGSIYETDNTYGFSHFIEHLIFRTKKENAYLIDSLIERGVKYGAFTAKEYTCYYFRTIPTEKEFVVKTIIDMFNSFKYIENADFETEKNIILSELNLYKDDPKTSNINKLMEISFNEQSISKEIIGDEETIKNATFKALKYFFKEYYLSSNIIVSITGNIDEYFHDYLIDRLSKVNKCSSKRKYPLLDFRSNISMQSKNLQNSVVDITYFYNNQTNNYSKLDLYILNDILGGIGKSSIIFKIIRESLGLSYAIQSSIENFMDLYLLNIHIEIDNIHVNKLFEELSCIFDDIELYITDKIIEVSYRNYMTSLSVGLESPMDIMFFHGSNKILKRNLSLEKMYLYKKPQKEKLLLLFKKIFNSRPSISISGNIENVSIHSLNKL